MTKTVVVLVSSAQYHRRAENQTDPEQCQGAERTGPVSRPGELDLKSLKTPRPDRGFFDLSVMLVHGSELLTNMLSIWKSTAVVFTLC